MSRKAGPSSCSRRSRPCLVRSSLRTGSVSNIITERMPPEISPNVQHGLFHWQWPPALVGVIGRAPSYRAGHDSASHERVIFASKRAKITRSGDESSLLARSGRPASAACALSLSNSRLECVFTVFSLTNSLFGDLAGAESGGDGFENLQLAGRDAELLESRRRSRRTDRMFGRGLRRAPGPLDHDRLFGLASA